MALAGRRGRFALNDGTFGRQIVPVASVMAASLLVLVPIIATAPMLPPFGLLMLLGWRLPRQGLWPAWAALPLGLFDDLLSGQPLGSGMALWTLALLAIDFADTRLVWRGHWQDWGIAAALVAAVLAGQWAFVQFSGGATPIILLVPQIVVAAMLYPLIARLCAALDRWRLGR